MVMTEQPHLTERQRNSLVNGAMQTLKKLRKASEEDDKDECRMMILIAVLNHLLERGQIDLREIRCSKHEFDHLFKQERLRYAGRCLWELRQGTIAPRLNALRVRQAVVAAGTHLHAVNTSEEELNGYERLIPIPHPDQDSDSLVVDKVANEPEELSSSASSSDFEPEVLDGSESHDTIHDGTPFGSRDTLILPTKPGK